MRGKFPKIIPSGISEILHRKLLPILDGEVTTMARPSLTRRRSSSAVALASVGVLLLAGCGQGSDSESSSKPDSGVTLTMWARHTEGDLPKQLADAYNKSHKNQVKVTIIPNDGFQQKVGAAAGSKGLPDLLSADVVYSPNYVKQGLFQDITTRVKALPFVDSLTPAHSEAASKDGKIFGIPLIVDSSLLIYNKDLFKKAGLDPEAPPKNFDDIYRDAKAVRALGGKTYGFYFAGNCPGCNAYTMFPYAAAAGTPPLQDDGAKASIDNDAFKATFELYNKMYDEDIVPPAAKGDDGSTWATAFNAGQIGIIPIGSFDFAALADVPFDWGVAGLPSPDGAKTSTFVGGDVAGITRSAKNVDQAWDFLSWTLGREAQVEVIAKSGNLPSRVDLAGNKYSAKDPRVVSTIEGLATGYTPSSTAYGDLFNNVNGPWMKAVRDGTLKGDSSALGTAQKTIQQGLDESQ